MEKYPCESHGIALVPMTLALIQGDRFVVFLSIYVNLDSIAIWLPRCTNLASVHYILPLGM